MVRIMIKGGVWKNTEDEILKAAVMKYGKMSWARVASLLSRKSAKQCKARWFEWLDPAIKKTEWTREEEEKLLHLAKLMPNQWRTIAPIVGRTAAQCLEHYERLLDIAQEKEGDVDASDARKLRPGEIDPAPETKPARPDPIDMDEDEKEMLQEARARLANTKGKKAKRKAREKQLEEARRLATLQKRRELKAAGIEHTIRQRKRKNIDYGREIPFYTTAPAGFHDVSSEKEAAKKAKADPKFSAEYMHKLEEKRRDKEEEEQRKRDAQKLKKMMKSNLPQQILAVSKLNDPIPVRKRVPLTLPRPQVTDAELEEIVKMDSVPKTSSSSEVTAGLTGDYKPENTVKTPSRTPSTSLGSSIILQEARNIAALNSAQTPLLGGENIPLEDGFSSVAKTPAYYDRMQTPQSVSTLLKYENPQISRGNTPLRSIVRDQFGLNKDKDSEFLLTPTGSISSRISKLERNRANESRAEIISKIESLPAPQYSYDISLPEVSEDDESKQVIVEDAEERDRRLHEKMVAEQIAEFESRSQVLKQELPRPYVISDNIILSSSEIDGKVNAAINEELHTILLHDAAKYPVAAPNFSDGKKKKKKRVSNNANEVTNLIQFSNIELKNAQSLILDEMKKYNLSAEHCSHIEHTEALDRYIFVPDQKMYCRVSDISHETYIEALMNEFELLHKRISHIAAKAEKSEARINLTQGGYFHRFQGIYESMSTDYKDIDTSAIELACFKYLQMNEMDALKSRINAARVAVRQEEEIDSHLQTEYSLLSNELHDYRTVEVASVDGSTKDESNP